jgi:hypothetical protein
LLLSLSQAFATQTVILSAGPDLGGAQGEAVIREVNAGQKGVDIRAHGLKPNEIYTVWLVNMQPKMAMAGLGANDFAFTSDAQGGGKYSGILAAAELGKWQLIEVALHPDRNPRNLKKMEIALKGELK